MKALSPVVSLATQIQTQPGVMAVLLGSGVSTGAGLPTGWEIVKELVRRAAAASGAEPVPSSDEDIELWWTENTASELGYSSILEAIAPTQAGRQAVLEGFSRRLLRNPTAVPLLSPASRTVHWRG